jgi:hypothetical protein
VNPTKDTTDISVFQRKHETSWVKIFCAARWVNVAQNLTAEKLILSSRLIVGVIILVLNTIEEEKTMRGSMREGAQTEHIPGGHDLRGS